MAGVFPPVHVFSLSSLAIARRTVFYRAVPAVLLDALAAGPFAPDSVAKAVLSDQLVKSASCTALSHNCAIASALQEFCAGMPAVTVRIIHESAC